MAEPQEPKADAATALPGEAASAGRQMPEAQACSALPSIDPIGKMAPTNLPSMDARGLDAEAAAAPGAPAVNTEPNKQVGKPAAAAVSDSSRFLLLAGSIAIAAALGSLIGSLSASGFAHVWSAAAASEPATASDSRQAIKTELAELSALRASLEGATRSVNSQFAKLGERLDRVERGALEPAAKIAHIADAVDRLERQGSAAFETTGAIANGEPSPLTTDEKRPVLHDWVVRDVRGNRALLESRYGGVFAIAAGGMLPRLGRIETIKRQDGQWVVITERGVITSGQ